MLKSVLAALAAFASLASAAFAQTAPAAQPISPVLYVARDADSTIYLYGAVHVRPTGADWDNPTIQSALDSAQSVWTEIDMSPANDARAGALAQQLGAAPPDRPLSHWLSDDENASLTALSQRLGIPAGALERFQPWVAALTLTVVPLLQAGYDPQSGIDRAVATYAAAHGKTMRAFETVDQQLSFLAGLSPELQRQMLREAIGEAEKGPALLSDMIHAWDQGDEGALEHLVVAETRDRYPEMYQALFVRRNTAWTDALVHELDGAGIEFVSVGAGHLVGPDSVIAQLRARGINVERVDTTH